MKIGKTNSIRFWQNANQVYNASIPDFMQQEMFFQPWKPTDTCCIQLVDEGIKGYLLEIVQNNAIIASIPFNRYSIAGKYVYQLSFIIGDYVSSGDFRFQLVISQIAIMGSLIDGDTVFGNLTSSGVLIQITGSVIDGDLTSGNIETNLFNEGLFGLSPVPCIYTYTLYWDYNQPWGTGVTMYTDPTLSTVLSSSYTKIAKSDIGEIYNISNGVVGVSTNIFC